MKLEDQVCALQYAKKLRELGVKQESLFWWSICHDCEKEYPEGSVKWELSYDKDHGENVSAFTATELGEMLPLIIDKDKRLQLGWGCTHPIEQNKRRWKLCYCDPSLPHEDREWIEDYSEADVRAKMLIYLLENGLMELPK